MRHLKSGRQLSRNTSHRKALLRNMVTSLIEHGRIETTVPKAKELRIVADRLVTLGKKGSLHARRLAAAYVRTPVAVSRLFDELAPGFAERHGGYTRIVRTRVRHGDAAEMAIIEFLPAGKPMGDGSVGPTAPIVKKAIVPTTKEKFEGGE